MFTTHRLPCGADSSCFFFLRHSLVNTTHTDKQIGLLGAITPAATFIVSPLWGALADQTGRHKDILIFTFVFSVISRLAFIWRVSQSKEKRPLSFTLAHSLKTLFP